jgi:hypothetical protein
VEEFASSEPQSPPRLDLHHPQTNTPAAFLGLSHLIASFPPEFIMIHQTTISGLIQSPEVLVINFPPKHISG